MGLDMFLMKKKKGIKYTDEESYESWKSRQLAYWRKANHIHRWFVENIQDNRDDCGEYLVPKDKLVELRDICDEIMGSVKLVPSGKTCKIYDWELKKEVDVPEMIVDNEDLCDDLLPTQSGFFFGGTSYDEWYLDDVKYTRDKINELLDNFDFNDYEIIYTSSW